MSQATRNLRVVDTETGEARDFDSYVQELEDHISGLQRDIRAEHTRFENLKRDKAAEAQAHEWWPRALKLFKLWKLETGHTNSCWSSDRFWLCVPAMKTYEDTMIEDAIRGLAFDPATRPLKNGKGIERYDRWETLFKTVANVEWYANRAPKRGGS